VSEDTDSPIARAVAALPAGALDERSLRQHIAPLFSRHRAAFGERIYLANHSLGRPLDATAVDVGEGLDAWYASMGGAWDAWQSECDRHRARLAHLMHAARADCVVPKTSAGQGLRAVLNTFDSPPRVVTTAGEFDSLDVILREYARRGRIHAAFVPARGDGCYSTDDIVAAIRRGCDLVVLSEVMFASGQRVGDLPSIVAAAHAASARVLLDVYHSLGVVDVDMAALGVDYAVGGCYKYLRGGPGACFLYVAPALLDARIMTLDIGWFAKAAPLAFSHPDPPRFAKGGNAWLESTPPALTYYQARAGLQLLRAFGVARIREYSLRQQGHLVAELAARGIAAIGGSEDRGAFVVVRVDPGANVDDALAAAGVVADVRGHALRLCPDIVTTADEIARAAAVLARTLAR
jgi:kynureninase